MCVGALTAMIPITVAGGMVLTFTETGMPKYERTKRRRATRRYLQKRRKIPTGFGNFGNVGY